MRHFLLAVAIAIAGGPAIPSDLEPWFIASSSCEAFQSKNTRSNPGAVTLDPGRAYRLLGRNAPGGEYYQLAVPDAPVTTARWVHVSCGIPAASADAAAPAPPPAAQATDAVLALNWQPAFCESRPGTPECRLLNAGKLRAAATRLSLHGLWPQDESQAYCDVPARLVATDKAGRWYDLPAVDLDADTRARLRAAMPGTASDLDRHEWLKHGTCHPGPGGADAYFDAMLALVDAIQRSDVGALLAARVGETVRTAQIRAAFDSAFGPGAGQRVQAHCTDDGRRVLIQELTIALRGNITPDSAPGPLMRAADPVSPGCPGGVIDAAGLQ